MEINDFTFLPKEEKSELIYEQGVYIGKRKWRQKTRVLFQLDSFYVEIEYNSYRRRINRIECTSSARILDEYLEQVNIEELLYCLT